METLVSDDGKKLTVTPIARLLCFFSYNQEFFTHLAMSPLLLKGHKIWSILGTHGPWTARVLSCAHNYCDKGQPLIMGISEAGDTQLVAKCLAVELSLPILKTFKDQGLNPDLPHARRTLYHYATEVVQGSWF